LNELLEVAGPLLADDLIIGLLGKSKKLLEALLASPDLINTIGFGMTPIFAACYALWPYGVRELLQAGAEPKDVLYALRLGVKDSEDPAASKLHTEILEILLCHGRAQSRYRPAAVPRTLREVRIAA
jgi:hypothetical protein